MNCEVCQKPIDNKELKSAKAGTSFQFFDNIRQKEVAYHPACYDEKWGKPRPQIDYNYQPKNV